MGESDYTAKLMRLWESVGAMTLPIVGGKLGKVGWPDRFISSFQWQGFIEFKFNNYPVAPLQLEIVKELNRREYLSAVIFRFYGSGDVELCWWNTTANTWEFVDMVYADVFGDAMFIVETLHCIKRGMYSETMRHGSLSADAVRVGRIKAG